MPGALFANQALVQRALRMAVERLEASVALNAESSGIPCAAARLSRWPSRDAPEVERAMLALEERRAQVKARLESLVAERQRLEQVSLPHLGS